MERLRTSISTYFLISYTTPRANEILHKTCSRYWQPTEVIFKVDLTRTLRRLAAAGDEVQQQ